MAQFRITSRPATFIDAGTHKMVSVSMNAAPLVSRIVECKRPSDLTMCILALHDQTVRDYPGVSFSTHQRLVEGRAPAGYRGAYFGMDHDASETAQ